MIDIAIKICKQKKGCLLVIMNHKFDYAPLIEQDVKPFNIVGNQRRVEPLAMFDGCCVFTPDGDLIAYAIQVLNSKPFTGFGTRHSAAYTASLNGNTVIISSEEDQKVRVFKDGKLMVQIDALEKNIENRTHEIVSIMESIGVGTIGTIGVGILAPTVGLTLIPGIVIFGSAHFIIKYLGSKFGPNKNPYEKML